MTSVSTLARMAHGASRREALLDPAKALGLAMERACAQMAGLDVRAAQARCADQSLADAIAKLDRHDLLFELHREGRFVGVGALCTQLRSGLVESQTLGLVSPHDADDRGPSGTDAALSMPMMSRFLTELVQQTSGTQLDGVLDGISVGPRLHSARVIELSLTVDPVKLIEVQVGLQTTSRTGELRLIVPPEPPFPEPEPAPQVDDEWSSLWPDIAQAVPAKLEAVLHRMVLGLDQVKSMAIGDLVPLPGASVGGVTMVDRAGARVARARLGQAAGHRAVRIEASEAPADQLEELSPSGGDDLVPMALDAVPELPSEPVVEGWDIDSTGAESAVSEPTDNTASEQPALDIDDLASAPLPEPDAIPAAQVADEEPSDLPPLEMSEFAGLD